MPGEIKTMTDNKKNSELSYTSGGVMSISDLYLSRFFWIISWNKRSRISVLRDACRERGLQFDKNATRLDLRALHSADVDDETAMINTSLRMAKRRGFDTSDVGPYRTTSPT